MRTIAFCTVVALAGCCLLPGLAGAESFEFKYNTTVGGSTNTSAYADMQDTYLYVREPDLNYGSTWPIYIDSWSGGDTPRQKNVLMRFGSLADFLPDDFQAGGATLRLQFRGNQNLTNEIVVGVYSMLASWTEDGATWASRDGTTAWNTAGAMGSGTDHAATAMYSWTIPGDAADGDWFDIPLDKSVVQGWIDDDTSNHGLVFYSNDNIIRGTLWYSNNAAAADRPVLVVIPEPGTVSILGVGVALLLIKRRWG